MQQICAIVRTQALSLIGKVPQTSASSCMSTDFVSWNPYTNAHIDNLPDRSNHSVDMLAMVHTPIPPGQIRKIEGAAKAVDGEFQYLMNQGTFPMDTVREKADVIREAKSKGFKVHFGTIMELCHLKNSQLPKEFQ